MVSSSRRDRGQAGLVVVMLATALFVSLTVAAVGFGGRLIDRTRAQTAADAAALASLTAGRSAARALAEVHGATLVMFERSSDGEQVTVVVRVGAATATAAATDAPRTP